MTDSRNTTDALDGWIDWCRAKIERRPKHRVGHMMLALIFEVRRLREQMSYAKEVLEP